MKISIDINRNNIKPITVWTAYILFVLFNVSLIIDSYREYEPIAAGRFIVVTGIIVLVGLIAFLIRRSKKNTR